MAITLARVDDRVIHGQTVTRWAASRPCNAILVISDVVAADELRKKVLKAAIGHLKLGIYTIEQGVSRPVPVMHRVSKECNNVQDICIHGRLSSAAHIRT